VIQRLAIIGLGLIGGSVARAVRAAGKAGSISGYDPDPQQREAAIRLGVLDRLGSSAADAVADANMVILAVPVLRTAAALEACLPGLRPQVVVSDVGSTKQSVLRDVEQLMGELPPWFVAAHPIAGTEKSGVANAQTELFRNRRVIITPHPRQSAAAQDSVAALWRAVGARVVEMDAARHDAIFAATSHLPHLLAYSFVDMLAQQPGCADIFANAGGGFRDFTRIASSSELMWHDIVRANAGPVGTLLRQQIAELQRVQELLDSGRWDDLKALFGRARAAREQYLGQIE
jgi:prephenate dehydrogenase